jgi:UDP-N-acetylmuramyl pentapeptide synthase
MISVAVAMAYGIDPNVALEDTSDFKPPEGRNMIINCGKNLVIVDDTYNASPDAMINAIKNLRLLNADVSIAILGEMKELGEYSKYLHEMIGELAAKSIDYLICYGQDTRYIIDKVLQNGFDANNVFYTTSIKNSYEIAGEILHKNDKKKAILIKGGRFVHMERVCMTLLGEDVRCNKALCEKYIHCSTCENVKKES